LGYDAPKSQIDALFNSMDEDGSGWIEYHELKDALSDKGIAEANKNLAKNAPKSPSGPEDVAGSGEIDFATGMRLNAADRDAADANNDKKLDFKEFCAFVRDREVGKIPDEELKTRLTPSM